MFLGKIPVFRSSKILIFITNLRFNSKTRLKKIMSKEDIMKAKLRERALTHFDRFYEPYYQDTWKSLRIALLSQQKYCAVVNNFCSNEDTIADLMGCGADNIIQLSKHIEIAQKENNSVGKDEISVKSMENIPLPVIEPPEEEEMEYNIPPGHDPRLYSFMPAEKVLSEVEEMQQKEFQENVLNSYQQEIYITGDEVMPFPEYLKVFAQPMGDVEMFPDPEVDDYGKLAYHLMDTGSIVPVLALGITPGDQVLDLCAAPGDKALAIIQTLLIGSLTCVDISSSLLRRLKKTLIKWYLPQSFMEDGKLKIIQEDGIHLANKSEHKGRYDKVLVDVPSFNDRETLHTSDERLFSHSQQETRLDLRGKQTKLLISALHCCKPGGSVVYCTSTLSPPQNDGVIQQVLHHFQTKEKSNVAVQDTQHLVQRLNQFMHFSDKSQYGQIVIPKLTANYGPIYFCKLKRLE